jgi:hypothetical protein
MFQIASAIPPRISLNARPQKTCYTTLQSAPLHYTACNVFHNEVIALLHRPRMIDEYGEFAGMRIDKGNRSTLRKPAPLPLCPPQIPHDLT